MFNNTQYFAGTKTVAEIKKLYRGLAMEHHPDRGGDTATMQAINTQYKVALERCNGETSQGDDGREHTYRYNAEVEQGIIDFIDRLIKSYVLSKSVNAYLIGTWVWIMGDTKPVKDTLKSLGCVWHSKRSAWYFQNDGYKHRFNKNVSFDGLAARYGASTIKGKEQESLA